MAPRPPRSPRLRAADLRLCRLEDRLTPAGTVTGLVFLDYNANGRFDPPPQVLANAGLGSVGVAADLGWTGPAVMVRAFDTANILRGTATTDAGGAYTLALSGTGPYRLEFDGLPAGGVFYGPTGETAGTAVQFLPDPAGGTVNGVNLALVRAEDVSPNDPLLVTSCYVFGGIDGANAASPVVVSFPYRAGTEAGDTSIPNHQAPPAHAILIPHSQVGTTWGLGFDRATNRLYMAAFMKRHSGFGPGGPGAIYRSAVPAPGQAGQTGVVSTAEVFVDLGAAAGANFRTDPRFTQLPPGTLPGSPTDPYIYDGLWVENGRQAGWDAVGKLGLGGLDVSPDGKFLFTVALGDRKLYAISTATGQMRAYDLPAPADLTGTAGDRLGDLRPFAVTFYRGAVYVGAVNTAESTQNAADLRAYVFRFEPGADPVAGEGRFINLAGASTTSEAVLTAPLNYPRGFIHPGLGATPTPISAAWRPWTPVYRNLADPNSNHGIYPQPWLTGLAFDSDGNVVLGLRDRAGDQFGAITFSNPDNVRYTDPLAFTFGITGGDTLRAFGNPAGGWVLESNGTGPGGTPTSAAGVGNGQGPGGGEFYAGDYLVPGIFRGPGPVADDHQELSLGGVLQLAGFPDLAVTTFDPAQVSRRYNAGGVRWYSNAGANAGNEVKAYELYQTIVDGTPPTFAKANGLGDLIAITFTPVEIGNRVWIDLDRDGRQDPDEAGLNGVQIELYGAGLDGTFGTADDVLIGTTTSAGDGNYGFTAAPAPAVPVPGKAYGLPLLGNTRYQVRIPLDQPALRSFSLTTADLGGNSEDQRDSDATVSQTFGTIVTAPLLPGEANHTYDAGFVYQLSLGDLVWEDRNNDGRWQAGEPGIAGVTVELLDQSGAVTRSTVTNASGGYFFTELNPARYRVRIPAGQSSLAGLVSSTGAPAAAGPFEPVVGDPANHTDHGTTVGAFVFGPLLDVQPGQAPTDDLAPPPAGLSDPARNEDSYRNQDFGFWRRPSLGDLVWEDGNNNGRRDPGEAGIGGVTVRLLNENGQPVLGTDGQPRTVVTAPDGGYLFADLIPGRYQVEVVIPAGYRSSSGPGGTYEPVTGQPGNNEDHGTTTGGVVRGPIVSLQLGQAPTNDLDGPTVVDPVPNESSNRTQDFGFFRPLAIGDLVFEDRNNNGSCDPEEPGLEGVTVRLLDAAGAVIATTTTAQGGKYRFDGLTPGTYQVEIVPPAGYRSSTGAGLPGDATGPFEPAVNSNVECVDNGTTEGNVIRAQPITLGPPGSTQNPSENGLANLTEDFGLFLPPSPPPPPPPAAASLSGYVYVDYPAINGLRQYDQQERGIGGVRVFLDGHDTTGQRLPQRVAFTRPDGFYEFTDLVPGTYVVREEQPDGFLYDGLDTPGNLGGTAGNDILSAITLQAGDRGVEYNFGEIPPTGTFGYVWHDLDRDGIFEEGEPPIAGVAVTVGGTAFAGTPLARPLTAADVLGGLTARTNEAGRYDFPILPPGVYTLTETQPLDFSDWMEQNGAPSGPAPDISSDVFANVVLGAHPVTAPIRGPFNYGETLTEFSSPPRRAPQEAQPDISKRSFLGSSAAATVHEAAPQRAGQFANVNAGAVPLQDVPGIRAAVADSVLQPLFAVAPASAIQPRFVVAGAGPGTSPLVRVFDYATGLERLRFLAYEEGYTGGVRTAVGDVDGDGVPDVVTATGTGGGPRVRVFNGRDGAVLRDFFAYESAYTGGVCLAVGDVDGDGKADLITGTESSGGPRVRVFAGSTGAVLADFFAFDSRQRGGVRVAAADLTGDGRAEIVASTGAGVPARVRVFELGVSTPVRDFAPYDAAFTGGVFVAAGDYDGDGTADIITGADAGGGPHVQVFGGKDGSVLTSFFAFDQTSTGGVRVAAVDLDGDGRAEIVTGAAAGLPRVALYSGAGVKPVETFAALDSTADAGVFPGAGTTPRKPTPFTGVPVPTGSRGRPGTLAALPPNFADPVTTADVA